MSNDDILLVQLRDMWTAADPAPVDLAERVLFTLELEDLEFELLRLYEAVEPVGARGTETARTVTFTSESVTVMLTLSEAGQQSRRLDGWIAPAAPLRLELRTTRGSQHAHADPDGRFAFDNAPTGLIQLVLHPTEGTDLQLTRPVVTPAIQI
jgi:hypothetical protein